MGEEPDRIRDEIEDTRERMTETVDALAYKADVKSRAKDRLHDTGQRIANAADSAVATVRGTASEAADKVGEGVGRVGEMTTSQAGSVRSTARRGASLAQENPMGLALGAAAAGFLIGIALPSSRAEDERLGEASDHVKQAAVEVGHEALDRGKRVAQEAAQAGVEAATTTGQEQAHELAAAAKDKVDEVMPASGDPDTSGGSDQNAGTGGAGPPG
jgi:hypothetical protein